MTIDEIAKKAGVSKATVSRYLNEGYVSEEKKEVIRAVIEETGYLPSRQARQLRTGKTGLIGVILPKINSEAVSRIVAGISQALTPEGYQILLANTDNEQSKELEYLEVFSKNRVDGVLLIATVLTPRHNEMLRKQEVPTIVIGQQSNMASSVYHDDFGAAHALTELMILQGRQKIGYIGVSTQDKAAGLARKQGFLAALAEHQIPCPSYHFTQGVFDADSGYQNMQLLLQAEPKMDAVFCATDFIAAGAMRYLREKQYKIPEDICIVGVGHTKMSDLLYPTLTTAHYAYKTSGIRAAKMLIEQLKDAMIPQQKLQLGYQIIRQQSA